jgi:hypothetical protein
MVPIPEGSETYSEESDLTQYSDGSPGSLDKPIGLAG